MVPRGTRNVGCWSLRRGTEKTGLDRGKGYVAKRRVEMVLHLDVATPSLITLIHFKPSKRCIHSSTQSLLLGPLAPHKS